MMNLDEINIRDPYVMIYEDKYYMYGTRGGKPNGFDVYISDDLKCWSEPITILEPSDDFWGKEHFWAPEVYQYNGKFYMFASFIAPGKKRGVQVLVSDTPDGRFVPITNSAVTPKDWFCLDGTFYLDKLGKPHMVFCHEWIQIGVGEVCEIQLSDDLTTAISKPRVLWCADEFINVVDAERGHESKVTDGPFLIRKDDDTLISLWSTFDDSGYVVLKAVSDNGDIDGNWTVCNEPLYNKDGGHCMVFKTKEGKTLMSLHSPNDTWLERPKFVEINI